MTLSGHSGLVLGTSAFARSNNSTRMLQAPITPRWRMKTRIPLRGLFVIQGFGNVFGVICI